MLISLEDAKSFLRITHNDDDGLISNLIAAATGLALASTGNPDLATLDPVPSDVAMAIRVGVSCLYDGLDAQASARMNPFLEAHRRWNWSF